MAQAGRQPSGPFAREHQPPPGSNFRRISLGLNSWTPTTIFRPSTSDVQSPSSSEGNVAHVPPKEMTGRKSPVTGEEPPWRSEKLVAKSDPKETLRPATRSLRRRAAGMKARS
jgi:hypothetical protein